MKASIGKLLNFLREAKQITIPIFQRPYCWTEKECKQLWDDLIVAGKKGRTHFFGSIVFRVESDGSFHVIDGQQRLTTVSLILKSLQNHLGVAERERFSADLECLPEPEQEAQPGKKPRRYNLSLTRLDEPELRAVLTAGKEGKNDDKSRIWENFKCFEQWLKPEDTLEVLRGLENLEIVRVKLEPIDDPQLVFESMNAKGVALSQIDLIRNFVLMRLPSNKQQDIYEKYWLPMDENFRGQDEHFRRFMQHYLRMRTRKVQSEGGVYETFKKTFRGSSAIAKIDEGLIKDLCIFATYYCVMALGRTGKDLHLPQEEGFEFENALEVGVLKDALADLRELYIYVAYPVLLRLYDSYNRRKPPAKKLTAGDFEMAIRLIESYLFRRSIFGGQVTDKMNRIFADFIDFENIPDEHYLGAIQNRFLSLWQESEDDTGDDEQQADGNQDDHEEKSAGWTYRFPKNEEFLHNLIEANIYERRWWKCLLLLRRLEDYYRKKRTQYDKLPPIEHIMPQMLSDHWKDDLGADWKASHTKWLHTLGNLTLVHSSGENTELSNNSFAEKKEILKNSPSKFRLNAELQEREKWGETQIRERGERLAKIAVEELWPAYPATQALEKLEAYRAWKNRAGN